MTKPDITRIRLFNQQIAETEFKTSAQIVSWMGAVQSQDFAAAKWAIGLRLPESKDTEIERVFNDGEILRTHVLRPTWHFVAPEDIRWMLALTAPRVNQCISYYYRKLELDDAVFKKSNETIIKALKGGNQLTRAELMLKLEQAEIPTNDLRSNHLMIRAELDAVVCSGARKGKQFTYALLEERVPPAKTLSRDEALAELTVRYFTSHSAATLQDFVWWSGLTTADARAGISMVKSRLAVETIDGKEYYFAENASSEIEFPATAYLLPNYDEYTVAYKDRSAIFNQEKFLGKTDSRGDVIFNNVIVIRGQIVGTWRRTLKKDTVAVEINPFISLSKAEKQVVFSAAQKYAGFMDKQLEEE